MSNSLGRILAIVRTDFRLRFRRVSTVVCFLLLSAFAYLWVPAPSSGRALIIVNDHRALYNSGAVGLATALLGMIFVGLFGYYFIANTIRRDLITRCGIVAASSPMRTTEYIVAKFLGNLAFLVVFLGGFMLSSMAMLLVRGEAPLEPLVFIHQYLLLTTAAMVFVSAVAVLFESIPFLAGKFGDVLFFLFWMGMMSLTIGNEASGGRIPWARYLDVSGFGFMIDQLHETLHTDSLSIGAAPFDPHNAPVSIAGLTLPPAWIGPRLVSVFAPLLLLPVAVISFHRFDPARTSRLAEKSRRNWIGRLQGLLRPLSRRFVLLLQPFVPGRSFLRAIWLDALLTFVLTPLALVAWMAAIVLGLAAPAAVSLPFIFGALGLIVSEIATRDFQAGTSLNLRAVPRLREHFVWWKAGSIAVLALFFFAIPLLRTVTREPAHIVPLLNGILFLIATATALGIVTSNPKTFIVAFLSFGYLVLNDHGTTPLLDFAGIYGAANVLTLALYFGLSLAAFIVAEATYRRRLLSCA